MKKAIITLKELLKKAIFVLISSFIALFLLQHLKLRNGVRGIYQNGVVLQIENEFIKNKVVIKNKNEDLDLSFYFTTILGNDCYYYKKDTRNNYKFGNWPDGVCIPFKPNIKDEELLYFLGATKDMRTIFFFGFLIDYDLLFEKWGIFY